MKSFCCGAAVLCLAAFGNCTAAAVEPASQEADGPKTDEHYIVDKSVLIRTPHGATLSAIVVRPRTSTGRLPSALFSTIQTDADGELSRAKVAADHGYAGVASDTRGKRLSPDKVVLFEHDARDLYWVIDWISKQPWSDGQVGMYGGSNAGFTQWAAAKSLHPALKTIVPYCPLDPGFGLPMNNNVFITANYDSHFFLGNTKYIDERFTVPGRAVPMLWEWYRSGRPYREIDQVDGNPNKYLQKFLRHPGYDRYWQSLTANGRDYRKLKIPILAIDGFYDDGQNNAVRRLQEHYARRPDAEHYLVIGPYDHFGVQAPVKPAQLRGYTIDPVAQFDTIALTFSWFDYVMRGGPKPALLKDRINYQVMGANEWRHAPSIEKMSNHVLRFYLSDAREGEYYKLARSQPALRASLKRIVDFSDRTQVSIPTYPGTIRMPKPSFVGHLEFLSEPFDTPTTVSGQFSANLEVILNKKDVDVAMVLFEVLPSGEYFHLSYTVQRASYAQDMAVRHLLTPGKVQSIPIRNTLLVSKQLEKGSRLAVMLDVNRGPFAQVNYGTGKDVSVESIADAKEPLTIEWQNTSTLNVPVWQ